MSYVLAISNHTLTCQWRIYQITPGTQPESVSVANVQLRQEQQSAFLQPTAKAGSTQQTVMLGVTYINTHMLCSTEKQL